MALSTKGKVWMVTMTMGWLCSNACASFSDLEPNLSSTRHQPVPLHTAGCPCLLPRRNGTLFATDLTQNRERLRENATAAEYARDFIYPDLVNQEALQLVQESTQGPAD